MSKSEMPETPAERAAWHAAQAEKLLDEVRRGNVVRELSRAQTHATLAVYYAGIA